MLGVLRGKHSNLKLFSPNNFVSITSSRCFTKTPFKFNDLKQEENVTGVNDTTVSDDMDDQIKYVHPYEIKNNEVFYTGPFNTAAKAVNIKIILFELKIILNIQ